MAQRGLLLVICLALGACGPEFPRDIHIDDSFDYSEEAVILLAIDEINALGQELLGEDLLAYAGRYADRDGFTLDDLGNDISVIYELSRPDKNYDYLMETYHEDDGGYILGYGPQSDILIFAFNMLHVENGQFCISSHLKAAWDKWEAEHPAEEESAENEGEAWEPLVCESDTAVIYLPELQSVTLHELGHFVGLSHIEDDNKAVMYPYANGTVAFTDRDKQAFCCVYKCVTDKYKCELKY